MSRKNLLLALILLSTVSSAQVRWNFQGGATFSSFDQDLMTEYGFEAFREAYLAAGGSATSDATNSIKAGGFLAIEVDVFLKEKSFLKTGIRYTTAGDSYFF